MSIYKIWAGYKKKFFFIKLHKTCFNTRVAHKHASCINKLWIHWLRFCLSCQHFRKSFTKGAKQIQRHFVIYLFLVWTLEEILESSDNIFRKSGSKYIFVRPKLVTGLPYNGVDHIESWNFVFGFTLKKTHNSSGERVQIQGKINPWSTSPGLVENTYPTNSNISVHLKSKWNNLHQKQRFGLATFCLG